MQSLIDALRTYVDRFNSNDEELYAHGIPNRDAADWMQRNIPLFECSDGRFEEIYYFRWWTFRKHIRLTPDGFVITEFLPDVSWAGKHNTINCAAGHHIYEGRWIRDSRYLDEYLQFWLRKGGSLRHYSFWIADAVWNRALVTGAFASAVELLPDLVANYRAWEQTNLDASGLFWQIDNRDGMERSIGGHGLRPTINSYMYADARAIAQLALLADEKTLAAEFEERATRLKRLVEQRLWDPAAEFFKTVPREPAGAAPVAVRELHGYTPWYANLAGPEHAVAWKQIVDAEGFHAPYGPTTAEQRSPEFKLAYSSHECQWNGPSWPYATAVTLTAMANLLNSTNQQVVSNQDYYNLLSAYTNSHRLIRDDGNRVPWIDENLNPFTGDWMARTILRSRTAQSIYERGKDYNHSTFCDLIITGLIGLRPSLDDAIEVNPLLPEGAWNYFRLADLRYRGHTLDISYDRDGTRYGQGPGLRLFIDGTLAASAPALRRISVRMAPSVGHHSWTFK